MKSVTKSLFAAVGAVAIVAIGGLVAVYFSADTVEARAFEKKFSEIQLGDPEAKVLASLGDPDAREITFRLGQERGFEEAYARARVSGSSYYLVWTKGVDVVFSVGIDPGGLVRAKEHGGT